MKILFLGNLEIGEIVSAPSKVGNEIFRRAEAKYENVKFFAYFQDRARYSCFKKLFGKEVIEKNILMFGLFPFIYNIIKFRPNIVQITSVSVYYLIALPLLKLFGSRIYYTIHSVHKYTIDKYFFPDKLQKRKVLISEKLSIFYSSKVFVLSENEKKCLLSSYNIPNNKIEIVDNGINVINIKKDYASNLEIIKIVTVGSLDRKEKGLDHLLHFLGKLNYTVKLTICYYKKHLEQDFISPKNVIIFWKEPLDEISLRQEFIKNDFFITFSEYEPFGIAFLEAMNSGLLFIASDRIGLTERFNKELQQFVIPFGEWEMAKIKLNNLIELLTQEKNTLSNLIVNFSNQFSWDKVTDKYFEQYEMNK